MKSLKNHIILALGILSLTACSGKDPIYWFEPESTAGGAGSNIPYYPQKPSGGENITPVDGYAPSNYSLVWSDEFDSQVKLYTDWSFEQGGTGWGNKELQYYCPGGIYEPTGQQTAFVSDGTLKIKAYKIAPSRQSDNCEYISARMNTKESWQYGYIEMRARMPLTKGSWPAFWMLLKDGPSYVRDNSGKGAEIDILEYVPGDDPNTIYFSAHSYNATPEAGTETGYVDPATGRKYSYCQYKSIPDPGNWHCYGMEWTHDYIRGFCDGVEYFYVPNPTPDADDPATWPFDQKFYLKLNLAVGGTWGGTPAANFNEETYEIDWVRVYAANGSTPDNPDTPTNPVEEKLTSTQWVLTGVLEEGENVTTSAGNKLTLNPDYTMAFDCTANGGQTFDHTWEGCLIDPAAYGEVSDMRWSTYTVDGKNYLKVDNGFLLVFAQEDVNGVYEIKELEEDKLTVDIRTYGETWTLLFEAAGSAPQEPTLEEKLTSTQWALAGVQEIGENVTTSVGNKLTLNSDHTLAFDCTANDGLTFDHTWEGALIDPAAYGAISDMRWSTYTEEGKDYLKVENGFLLVFAQEDVNGVYEIKELTADKLTVEILTYEELWTFTFEAVK
ncbi:MAG: glycoside hydrolase family 16 protein [Bacteroidales bacterium]|nr:glycoside hydrolase family 16 protein [Bacteroidales bacterium]